MRGVIGPNDKRLRIWPNGVTYQRNAENYYPEPSWAVELLADHTPFPGLIYDPACGSGTIPKVFKARGHATMATDLSENRPYGSGGVDFLADSWQPEVDHIICNPPYDGATLAQQFIYKSLLLAKRKVAMFLPLQFLASQSRYSFFQDTRPQEVLVLSSRPSCPPGDLLEAGKVQAKGGMRDYMWVVWNRTSTHSAPTMNWLIRR